MIDFRKGFCTMISSRSWFSTTVTVLAALGALQPAGRLAAQTDFASAVIATRPLAYYTLDATSGKSKVGTSTYSPKGGVSLASPGAGIAGPGVTGSNDSYVKLDGKNGYLDSTQKGGVGQTASMMAWVNLAALPSQDHHFFYIAGESEYGNDLDMQFETDDVLKFFTASGGHVEYAVPKDTLLNQWHMIVVTVDTAAHTRTIYWDGKLVAHDAGGGRPGKTSEFSIGASTVFGGRWFDGGVEHVALWNRALKGTEVAALYAASKRRGAVSK
jgi:hypothetical protein